MTDSKTMRFSLPWLIIGVVLGAVIALGIVWDPVLTEPNPAAAENEIWTCGMHPSVRQSEPGECPICFMPLVPVRASDPSAGGAEDILTRLEVTEAGRALAMIETVPVTFRHLEHEIDTTGRLTLDERRVTHVHARIAGWIEEVFVEFTGVEITPGDALVSLYSEELVTAQEEYLLARRGAERLDASSRERVREGADALAEAARQRLRRWDITDAQIETLERTGEIQDRLTLHYQPASDAVPGGVVTERLAVEGHHVNRGDRLFTVADLSTLWMMADIYESEMAWIEVGQRVEITASAYPGRVFEGEIAFIEPMLDPDTRAVQVRVDVQNPAMDLRPEMWVDARIRIPLDHANTVLARLRDDAQRQWAERWGQSETPLSSTAPYLCPMQCEGGEAQKPDQHCPVCRMIMVPRAEVVGEEPTSQPTPPAGTVLTIPDVAVLRTGQREVVYIEESPGNYAGREVITGPTGMVMIEGQRETHVPVLAGLEAGMRVVTRGNFLLDSQTTLTGGAAAAYGSALDTDAAPAPAAHPH